MFRSRNVFKLVVFFFPASVILLTACGRRSMEGMLIVTEMKGLNGDPDHYEIVITPYGKYLFVAEHLQDRVSIINTTSLCKTLI